MNRLTLALITIAVFGLAMAFSHTADARSPMPRPPVNPPVETFQCEVPKLMDAEARKPFDERNRCMKSFADQWFQRHPDTIATYSRLYQLYAYGFADDLRGSPDAGAWVEKHPTDFGRRSITLTEAQVREQLRFAQAAPVPIRGVLERFFVDRDNKRLFVTSSEEGLVSVDISKRFQFSKQGASGHRQMTDFFVYNSTIAFAEEKSEDGLSADLIVLDISDRVSPTEITRLRSVIPSATPTPTYFTSTPSRAPTFLEYVHIIEGRALTDSCQQAASRTFHQPNIHCYLDGRCFETVRSQTRQGRCTTQPAALQQPRRQVRPQRRRVSPDRDFMMEDSMPTTRGGSVGSLDGAAQERRRPTPRSAASAPSAPAAEAEAEAGPMPQGGQGGAGSLTGMLAYNNHLYVLSGDHGQANGWLLTFDVSNPRSPSLRQVLQVENGPEALQRHDNLLLIAGRDALVTASVAQPGQTRVLGEHRQFCPVNYDPVVVRGSTAYRTIIVDRPWAQCQSQMEVIDLSRPHEPRVQFSANIARPRGLAVLGDRLFVANETVGVLVYDITDPNAIRNITTWQLPNVKDLVVSDFDLYALTSTQIDVFPIAPLYLARGWEKKADEVRPITVVGSRPRNVVRF